jgi:hypothetical protein
MGAFHRQVLGWNRKVYKKRDEVFQLAFMRLADEMQAACPKDTHFLMSSLEVSKSGTPRMSRPNPQPDAAPGTFSWDRGSLVGVVENSKYGEKLFLGYTAEYAAYVHDGHGNTHPRPWVMLVAQRWREIVRQVGAEVRARA